MLKIRQCLTSKGALSKLAKRRIIVFFTFSISNTAVCEECIIYLKTIQYFRCPLAYGDIWLLPYSEKTPGSTDKHRDPHCYCNPNLSFCVMVEAGVEKRGDQWHV